MNDPDNSGFGGSFRAQKNIKRGESMSIRRKILISNIILVCVPVVLAILLQIGYLFFSDNAVINPLQNVAESGGSLSQAQEPLYF